MSKDQEREREAFEWWCSNPPREWPVGRHPDDGTSAWPGNYINYIVDAAWYAWQARASRATHRVHCELAAENERLRTALRRLEAAGHEMRVSNERWGLTERRKKAVQEWVQAVIATGLDLGPNAAGEPIDRAEVLRLADEMNRRFTSMNSVPIDKAMVPTAEWSEMYAALVRCLAPDAAKERR